MHTARRDFSLFIYSGSRLRTGEDIVHIQNHISSPNELNLPDFLFHSKLQLTFSKKWMADLGEVDVFELITNLCFSELFIVKAAPDNTSTITKNKHSCTFQSAIIVIYNGDKAESLT